MQRMLSLVIAGFGTVGQGLAELLLKRDDFRVVAIADSRRGNVIARQPSAGLDLKRVLELAASGSSIVEAGMECPGDVMDVLGRLHPHQANVLVEATHSNFETGQPAFDYMCAALERGMHIASTNKGPFACHYADLSGLASRKGLRLEFEGTVMSGTPLIKLCRDLLQGAGIREMRGILNGTVNYILTRMMDGRSFAESLAEAQARGIAEANPANDLEGRDAAAKAAILSNVAFNAHLGIHEIARTGIDRLTPDDMERARAENSVWKLIARLKRCEDGRVRGSVAPELLRADDPLSCVAGAANALEISTEALGAVTITGPGAGRIETGYALLSDLLEIQKSVR